MTALTNTAKYILQGMIILVVFISLPLSVLARNNVDYPSNLPIAFNTTFHLTSTPYYHNPRKPYAAVDMQIANSLGMVSYGAPLYATIDGYATYVESENNSALINIDSYDGQWKVMVIHIVNDTDAAQAMIETFPKRVVKGELIGYQGNSGIINGKRVPVHTHVEIFKNVDGKFTNDDEVVHICSLLNIQNYCNYVDKTGRTLFIKDI